MGIVIGLKSEQYPILSDLLEVVQEELYIDSNTKEIRKDISDFHLEILEKININLRNLIDTYGKMFNGHSTIENFMDEKLKIKGSAIWSASIHYNTDNIHVHIAVVEPNPTRERGSLKPKTFISMKSKAVNEILNMSRQYKKINKFIREDIIKNREEKLFVFILCLFFISYLLSDLVHVYLRTIWNIFSLVLGVILSMHSPNNPKKKIYNSVYYTLKRKNTYKPISTKGD